MPDALLVSGVDRLLAVAGGAVIPGSTSIGVVFAFGARRPNIRRYTTTPETLSTPDVLLIGT